MPTVGKKKFPYTAKGKKAAKMAAKMAAKKTGKKVFSKTKFEKARKATFNLEDKGKA